MSNFKLIIVLTISLIFTGTIKAEDRMCFGQVPVDASNQLSAKIVISQGNKIFRDRKCSGAFYNYYKENLGFTTQGQCDLHSSEVSLDKGFAPLGVFFRGWESTPKNDIKNYHWDIKDQSGLVLASYDAFNAAYVFEKPGKYIATLTVTNKYGASDTASHDVTVWERTGKQYYVDSNIGDDRYNGRAKTPDITCDALTTNVGQCSGPWKTATRAFGEMSPYQITEFPQGKYTAAAACMDQKTVDVRRYKQGNFVTFRSSSYVESEALKDSNGSPLAVVPTSVCLKTVSKRASSLLPGDEVLFKRNQQFDLETAINVMSSYTATNEGTEYQYEKVNALTLATVGHWPSAIGINFSAYGSGNKPIIKNVGTSSSTVFKLKGVGMMHLSIMDLSFDLHSELDNPFNHNRATFLVAVGEPINLVFKRIDVRHMNQGIIASAKDGDGLFVFDSNFYDSKVTQFYSHEHADVAIVNSKYDYSANHLIYSSINSGLIYNNVLTRPAFGRTAFRLANGSMENPDKFVWIAKNKMIGWIDPRTSAAYGRAFANGKRYNFSLVNISPNVPKSDKAVHDIVFTDNYVKNAENMLMVGNAENVKITDNIFTTADSSSATRIRLNGLFSRRPLKNILIDHNKFIEKDQGNSIQGGFSGATIGLSNFYQEKCADQENNEDIQITNNIFGSTNYQRRPFSFDGLKQLGNLQDLNLSQAESVLYKTVNFTNNTVNSGTGTPVLLQIGGDNRAIAPTDDFNGWASFYEGNSPTGGEFRLYNTESNFIFNLMAGVKSKLDVSENKTQQENIEIQDQSSMLDSVSEKNDLVNDGYVKKEPNSDRTTNPEEPSTATSRIGKEGLSEIKPKNDDSVTLGAYNKFKSQGVGLKNRSSCRAVSRDGRCLLQ